MSIAKTTNEMLIYREDRKDFLLKKKSSTHNSNAIVFNRAALVHLC